MLLGVSTVWFTPQLLGVCDSCKQVLSLDWEIVVNFNAKCLQWASWVAVSQCIVCWGVWVAELYIALKFGVSYVTRWAWWKDGVMQEAHSKLSHHVATCSVRRMLPLVYLQLLSHDSSISLFDRDTDTLYAIHQQAPHSYKMTPGTLPHASHRHVIKQNTYSKRKQQTEVNIYGKKNEAILSWINCRGRSNFRCYGKENVQWWVWFLW